MIVKRNKITPYIINAYTEYQSCYIEKDYSSFDEFLSLNFDLTFLYASMFDPSYDMAEFPSEEHYFLFLMRYS